MCTDFFVLKDYQAILGLDASERLRLLREVSTVAARSDDVIQESPQLFQGTGRINCEYKIVLRGDAVPTLQPAQRGGFRLRCSDHFGTG